MDLEPKIEPGSPSTNHVILDKVYDGADMMETRDLEGMTIPSFVHVLLGACRTETFDRVGGVLVSRDLGLKEEIQLLQQKLEMERLSKLQLEDDFKEREEIVEKGKKLQESHDALLKVVKIADLENKETLRVLRKTNIEMKLNYEAKLKENKVTIEKLTKKNIELESEVKKLKEKRVDDGNGLVDVLRKKNAELVSELKEKRVEEANVVVVLRKENARLEHELLELNKKWVEGGKVVKVLNRQHAEFLSELRVLKEKRVKDVNDLAVHIKENAQLEHEVLELRGKKVEDDNALKVLKTKKSELESQVLEVRKLKEKWEEDRNELENKVLELEKLKERWLEDSNACKELQNKVGESEETVTKKLATISELRTENSKLADEKRKVDSLLESLNTKFRGLHERVARLEDDSKLFMSVDGGNNEVESPVDAMVADFEDKDEEDVGDNEFRSDTVEEDAPMQRNEDGHHSHGGTQLQKKGSKEVSPDSKSGVKASGCLKMQKVEIINLDDEDDDPCMSQGVHEKKVIFGICMKDEHPSPSSSIPLQQKTKFANAADTIKRKYYICESETSSSSSSSSDDSSYLDMATIRSMVSQAKKKKKM